MQGAGVLEKLIEKKLLNLIKTLLSGRKSEYYLQELSELSKIPVATTFRLLNKLVMLDLVKERKISRFTIYQLAEGDEITFLRKLFKSEIDPLGEFITALTSKYDVKSVFLQGSKSKEKANVLILSHSINNDMISELAKEIKVKYNYGINFMIVTPEQFEQMEKMGFSSQKKELLFSC